ncbi:polyprenol phosphomannose-dependent alpha 1,6 mannosyltransferase MptB [Streptomyces scopuliridis]|uniref:polyprenol phosphomannose-dependent alpha 1,6 mannosyltransferase MptB n=1 Tax=Streptomyces scopuliridis TaxID=452529 RepID=UPI002DDC099F|nr:polyprenol phosphomannose-dependent alpha 1,6 mannosyltransferase MptB [Streptomyces scopuliridis]WSB37325.1 polyprenol phosphomannose-dependent alpha 1,6 mannosyltransferase MptB [Streptomyces scopuliridis]
MWALNAGGYRRLGAVGSVAAAVGGWVAGTLPARDPWGLWVPHGSVVTVAGEVLAYVGLTLLVVAWWRYGRTGASTRDTLVTLAWWATPLALAPPLYSADVYSYIAQGAMVLEGHDVYSAGPSVLDPAGLGGDAAASVGGNWTDSPAPYGPFFLILARGVTWVTGGTIVPAVLGMRLIAVGALVLIVWALRHLARERGTSESGALWLGALNPLLLTHVIGGMHNDGLMIGLMLAGVVLALRGRWIAGGALVGLAMMVKSPAAMALLFIGVFVGRAATGPFVRRVARGVAPGLVAVAVAVAAALLGGTGFGWLRTQSVAGTIHTALSATSDLGLGLGELLHLLVGTDPGPVKTAVQNLGLGVALVLIACLAWRSARGREGSARGAAAARAVEPAHASDTAHASDSVRALDPVHALGLALLALVALSPMVQPWYLLWGVTVIAATAPYGRTATVLTVLSAALVYETHPSGATPWYGFVLVGVVCVIGTLLVRRDSNAPGEVRVPGDELAVGAHRT